MTYPKRYSAFYTLRNGDTGLASFGVEPRDDGIYVEHSEYWKLFEEVTRLKAEVERLTKAGDVMAEEMLKLNHPHASIYLWCKAKEGKQS